MPLKKFRVSIKAKASTYSVEIEADEKSTLENFAKAAKEKIKEQYGIELPDDEEFEIEFEIVS